MSNINKAAVLNPFSDLATNILDYVPRATTSEFGIVAIGSGINVDNLGRIYLDTQEYSDRLAAIEAQASSSLATQQTAVSAAIAQVNLAQSQSITALTLEVNNLKTNLTAEIAAAETELINRADQLAQNVANITQQLTQDKATFTQEIQDALDYLKGDASVASALRTPRKIQGVDFDGTQDISLPVFTTQTDGLVPKRVGATSTKYLREDGTWVIPTNTTYALLTKAVAEVGTATTANTISAQVLKDAIQFHAPTVTTITGNAGTASKLQTSRTISLTGNVAGSVSFDGSANASIATTITGLGVANGIATLDSSGQVPSTQLPSYVDDVLEYMNVAAFPPTGESGKIYVETTGNTTYRWGGSGYVKITSGEVSSVAGKTGVITLTKADVGLPNVDNTADSTKSVASAAKLTTARTIGGISFDGTANINLPGVNTAGNQNTSGNAGSASKLATARTLTVGRTGKTFDGSVNIAWTATEVLPTATSGQFLKFDGTAWIAAADNDTTYSAMTQAEANTGTDTANRVITAAVLKEAIQTHAPVQTSITGNAATATKLATARTISLTGAVTGSVSFDGSGNASITTAVNTTVAIAKGGTGATTAEDARTNLSVPSVMEMNTAIASATPNATETIAGKAKIATTAIAQAGTNDTDFITPLKLKNIAFGAAQSSKSKTLVSGTTYTNTTNKPITLSVSMNGSSGASASITVNNFLLFSTTSSNLYSSGFTVGVGESYKVTGNNITAIEFS